MLKRILSSLILMILIIGICGNVKASELKTQLDVIQQSSEIKYLENNQGYISKTIVDSNKDTGEVTIELKLANTKKEITKNIETEIILVIDNSGSMDYQTADGKTRKQILIESARGLVNKVFETSTNVKIGIVKFCGETGLWAPLHASSVITKPTSNKEDVLKGLTTIENKSCESGTNIQKGLMKAEETFSKDVGNKVIILLTDGCPNEDGVKDENGKIHRVGDSEMILTNETYSLILQNTKDEILKIKQKGITLISLMTGVNSDDVDKDGNIITSTEDDIKAIEKIFGTQQKPTAGKFYNAKTTDVNNVIQNDISKDVQEILNTPLNTVKIVDYFPNNITENFEFSYEGKPSLGEVTEEINPKDNAITWDIGTLSGNSEATLKYKLKIKDMKNTELLNKVISTNEKVELNYKDKDDKEYQVTLTSSPRIELTEVKEDVEIEDKSNIKTDVKVEDKFDIKTDNTIKREDTTIAKEEIPKAGISMTITIIMFLFIILGIIYYKKCNKYKDIK